MSTWYKDVSVLYSEEVIRQRLRELGQKITKDFAGQEVCIVGVLKGSFIFIADLVREIELPVTVEFIGISSYGSATESSGVVQITQDLKRSIEGVHVVIVEDIIDTGLTMRYLLDNFATRKPASLKVCSLLEKPENAKIKIDIDYVGFVIPNHFVVGYGLDVAQRYRNLPFIGIYHPPAKSE
eukprot:Colp12_sorted_trinity150504_noHs@32166